VKRQSNGRSTIYQGSDGYWHGRVIVGVTDQGKPDRRHVMSRSKSVVTTRVRELEKKRENGSVPFPGVRWTVAGWLEHWLENIARPTIRQSSYDASREVARQKIAAPDGPETHLSRKRVPVAQSTILSSGTIDGADTLTIEVIQPDSMPAVVRIVWPTAATITTPAHYREVASAAMRLLAEASTTLARIRASRRL